MAVYSVLGSIKLVTGLKPLKYGPLDFNILYLNCKNPICAELTECFG